MVAEDDGLYANLDPNKVLDAFGKYGKFQMRTYFLANTVHLLYAVNMMIMPFITEEPNFTCNINQSISVPTKLYKKDECTFHDAYNSTYYCNELADSAHIEYANRSHTISAEYNLICSEKNSAEHASSVFLLGGMLVAPLVMQLSDLYGRRLTYLIPLYASIIFNLFCIVAPNYTFFLVFRFLGGVANTSFGTIGITLSLESVSTKFRNMLPIVYNTFWILGYLLSGVLRLYIADWRVLYLAVTIPGLLCIPFWWLIPESLHWLCTMKKHSEVREYIQRVEYVNGRKIDLEACQALTSEKSEEVKRTIIDIFTNPAMFINLLINGYILIVLSFTYWALSLFSTDLAEDKMTGFFLSGLIEIPGAILTNVMIHFWNRKCVSLTSLTAQAICAISMLASPSKSFWLVLFPLIMKCFCVVLWSNHPLHCSESTPTSVRNVFLGFVGFLRDFGGVVAPYLKRLQAVDERAPTLLLAALSVSAALLVFLLPETRDKELPEDIPDFDPGPVIGRCIRGQDKETYKEDSPMLNGKHQ